MFKIINLISLCGLVILTGAGCDLVTNRRLGPRTNDAAVPTTAAEFVSEEDGSEFFDSKAWVAGLVKDSQAGHRANVRLPLTHVYEFGCATPASYCISEISAGCYGPYVTLEGDTKSIDGFKASCLRCDREDLDNPSQACVDFQQNYCRVQWQVEGYFTGESKYIASSAGDSESRSCALGQNVYRFHVLKSKILSAEDADGFDYTIPASNP